MKEKQEAVTVITQNKPMKWQSLNKTQKYMYTDDLSMKNT